MADNSSDPQNQLSYWEAYKSRQIKEGVPDTLYDDLVKNAIDRAITYEEFYYLLSQHPFLDIHHPDGFTPLSGRTPKSVTAQSGWTIQDYGDRLRTSAGR